MEEEGTMAIQRVLIGGCFAGILAGCATYSADLEKAGPDIQVHTDRDVRDYVVCVSGEWAKHRSEISTVLLKGGYRVSLTSADSTFVTLTAVDSVNGGVDVKYYVSDYVYKHDWMGGPVEDCR